MAQQQLQQHHYQPVSQSIRENHGVITYDAKYEESSVSNSSKRLYQPDIDEYHLYANHHCINFSDDESYDFEAGVSFDNFLDTRKGKSKIMGDEMYFEDKQSFDAANARSSKHSGQENHDVLTSSSAWILFDNSNGSRIEQEKFDADSFSESAQNQTNIAQNILSANPVRYEDILSSAGYSMDQISSTQNRVKEEILISEDHDTEEVCSSEEETGSMIKILKKEVRLLFPKQYLDIKDSESQDSKFIMIDQWQDSSSWNSLKLAASTYHYKSTNTNLNQSDFINTFDSIDEHSHRHVSFKEKVLDRYPCGVYNYRKNFNCHKTTNKKMFYGYSKIMNLSQEDKRRLKQVMERIKPCSNTIMSANENKLTFFVC